MIGLLKGNKSEAYKDIIKETFYNISRIKKKIFLNFNKF